MFKVNNCKTRSEMITFAISPETLAFSLRDTGDDRELSPDSRDLTTETQLVVNNAAFSLNSQMNMLSTPLDSTLASFSKVQRRTVERLEGKESRENVLSVKRGKDEKRSENCSPQTWKALIPHMKTLSASEKVKIRHCVLLTVLTCEHESEDECQQLAYGKSVVTSSRRLTFRFSLVLKYF